MPRQTQLDKHWQSLMSLCLKEKRYADDPAHPKLRRLISQQIDELGSMMGFSQKQITTREFRAERDGDRILRLLVDQRPSS